MGILNKRHITLIIGLFLFTVSLLTSCSEKETELSEGNGSLSLGISFDTKTNPVITTRATERDYMVKIIDSEGQTVKRYNHKEEIPEEIRLYEGDYTANVTSGENPDAAFNSPYFEGSQGFTVKANQTSSAKIVCKLANAKISVVYSEQLMNYFTDLKTVVGKGSKTLQYTEQTTEDGYFKTGTDSIILKWTFSATNALGKTLSREDKITVKPRYHYTLKFDVAEPGESGGSVLTFSIIVEEDATIIEDPIGPTLLKIPEINGIGFPIDQQLTLLFHQDQEVEIGINGFPSITAATISHNCQYLLDNHIPAEFDFLNIAENELNAVGISRTKPREKDSVVFSLTTLLKEKLPEPPEGESTYSFNFKIDVTAENGKRWQEILKLLVLKSDVVTLETTKVSEIWAYHATVHGKWVGTGSPTPVIFQYQKDGDGENWQETPEITVAADGTFNYELSGLQDGTKYNFRAKAGNVPGNTFSLTTDKIVNVPNLNFDTWTQSGSNWFANADAADSYWASGNTGVTSSLAGGNAAITAPETIDVVRGNAAKMRSITGVTLVKAAAGNLFIGTYSTDMGNPSNSVKFGRAFNGARPVKLAGWYKYTSMPTNSGSQPADLTKDVGNIYIWLQNANGDEIGRGNIDIPETVNEYTYFEIDIQYTNTNAKPAKIAIVATSSKYGGDFSGSSVVGKVGAGSTLWVDEFELIYY